VNTNYYNNTLWEASTPIVTITHCGKDTHIWGQQSSVRGEGLQTTRVEGKKWRAACHRSRVTRHASHVTRHTSHVTPHTSHVTRHTSHVTRHTSHLTPHTSHLTRHTSHLTRHTSHVTPHTSHITRHLMTRRTSGDFEGRGRAALWVAVGVWGLWFGVWGLGFRILPLLPAAA